MEAISEKDKNYISSVLEYVERVYGADAVDKMLTEGKFIDYAKEYNEAMESFYIKMMTLRPDEKEVAVKSMARAVYNKIRSAA